MPAANDRNLRESPKDVHAQLQRWANHDQNLRKQRFEPFLKQHADELAKDNSKANVIRQWTGNPDIDASGHWDPFGESRWHGTAKRYIRDNIGTILADPGGWISQNDGHNVVLAHIIVQHMDDDPDFQAWFLEQMRSRPSVARANAEQIRYLSDRVEVNRTGYWLRPDAGSDPDDIPRGTYGTQGNRFSMDHARKQDIDKDTDMTEMRKWINSVDMTLETDAPRVGDRMLIEFRDSHVVDTAIVEMTENEIYLLGDDTVMRFVDAINEAEYHGRKVPLGKPMRGDVKKFKVYVKDPKTGNVKKVNFGDKSMRIKKSNPKRRKSFRARHHCSNPGPRTSARYWSCRKW
jgi:hypothetical protein